MFRWIPYAFVRIALLFMLGIWVGISFPQLMPVRIGTSALTIALLFYVVVALVHYFKRSVSITPLLKFCAGFFGLSSIALGGYLNVHFSTERKDANHFSNLESPVQFLAAVIVNNPQERTNSWKAEAVVKTVKGDGSWKPCNGKMLLYFSKADFSDRPKYGDVLLMKGAPQEVPPPANPDEFDYKEFLSYKNIYHQMYLRKKNVLSITNDPTSWIDAYALQARVWADQTLQNNVAGEREKALTSGLVLGITDGLDDEVISAYKATGSMHVLAVSGLHVGILYGLLMLILKPLNKGKRGSLLAALICIIALWIYGFITGLSPSVLRAVSMFSFVVLAKPMRRRTNIYNTLAASAFFILLYDPFMMMSVGFQLSYLAVVGIVYIQPGLYHAWVPTTRIADEIWKVTAVSIAAQLATLPLCLYYFHQFPNYFLLSNLFVIPASFVVLVLGILILLLHFISPVAYVLGFLLEWTIRLSNYIVFWIEDLPFSVINNIYLTSVQAWMIAFLILSTLLLLKTKAYSWLTTTATIVVLFAGTQWHRYRTEIAVPRIAVYNISGHSAFDLSFRGKALFGCDSSFANDPGRIEYHITPYRIRRGVIQIQPWSEESIRIRTGCRIFVWNGKTFLQIFDKKYTLPDSIKVDYVIISNDAVSEAEQMFQRITAHHFIMDGSNTRRHAERMVKQAAQLEHDIHCVLLHGAFEQSL